MKTKIIYISGSEIFEMSAVRAAMDEVRAALGLGHDTVLFGVPVDADDALCKPGIDTTTDVISESVATAATTVNIQPSEPVIDTPQIPTATVEKPEKKAPRRKETKKSEPINDTESKVLTQKAESDAPVVPILSVLASKKDDDLSDETITDAVSDYADIDAIDEKLPDIEPGVVASDSEPVLDTDEYAQAEITDDLTEDVPEPVVDATLEQLLESMTPLREDHGHTTPIAEPEKIDDLPDDDFMADIKISDDTDATLNQLATEFAKNEDKIVPTKSTNHGKIGKLKNILPFKKAKRDDTGLMGDLFGWAGIAANDEDFSIPGFFTSVGGKK